MRRYLAGQGRTDGREDTDMQFDQHYRQITSAAGYVFDEAQAQAAARLQALGEQLSRPAPPAPGWLTRTLGRRQHGTVPGLYLWGGVGRGKTWLMDLFFDQLPLEKKLRLHFHRFMQEIQDDLAHLRRQHDPLRQVGRHFATRARVLCLDEFYVEDITDAMLLHGLLGTLTAEGISLVLTSNSPPDELYKNGLQRERFLPAVELIKRHTQIIELRGDTDHRLRRLKRAATWYTPADARSEERLAGRFRELAPCAGIPDLPLTIHHRQIPSRHCADDVVWFDFYALCQGPRSSHDYIEIARRFHTVFISAVPIMDEGQDDWAHRFIDLVDEFYDRRVKLLLSAEAEPEALYRGRRLGCEFQRTVSRLIEMRSEAYLGQPHRP